jgi:IS5 family transposase
MTAKYSPPTVFILPSQQPLRQALPEVRGNADYRAMEDLLGRIDEILRGSGVEDAFVRESMAIYYAGLAPGEVPKPKAALHRQRQSELALRTMVLKALLGEDFRGLSRRLAEAPLLRAFCGIEVLGPVRVPSKSSLQRYATWLPHEKMRMVTDVLTRAAGSDASDGALGLADEIELALVWMDSTCLEANIHFPVDWVLLRDAARTLVKAILVVRSHGLLHRIGRPEEFLSRMNALCMEMAACGRKKDGRKLQKAVLRKMKKLAGVIAAHARRYRDLLDAHWDDDGCDLSRAQAEVVLRRIDGVLAQLPAAVDQAHARIISGGQVASADKILSLYEGDVHVVKRGKAGGAVEFGNGLSICEQADGLIIDHELSRSPAPADSAWLPDCLERVRAVCDGPVYAVCGDRGFDSAANRELLGAGGTFNGLCPRSPATMVGMLGDDLFVAVQKRRAQTEGRVGILKNKFLGGVPRSKGFAGREAEVDWAVLAHNLWVLARKETAAARAGREAREAAA